MAGKIGRTIGAIVAALAILAGSPAITQPITTEATYNVSPDYKDIADDIWNRYAAYDDTKFSFGLDSAGNKIMAPSRKLSADEQTFSIAVRNDEWELIRACSR